MIGNAKLTEVANPVVALPSVVPSSASPKWASLKNYNRATVLVYVNNATTVTGSAIALQQATTVTGTGAKTLAFTTVDANLDTAASDALTATAVSSNTFTTDSANSKSLLYVIEIKAADLDVNGGFDCFKVTVGNATAATVTVIYLLREPRFAQSAQLTALSN